MRYLLDSHVVGSICDVEDLEESGPFGDDGSAVLAFSGSMAEAFRILIGRCRRQICFLFKIIRNVSPTACISSSGSYRYRTLPHELGRRRISWCH